MLMWLLPFAFFPALRLVLNLRLAHRLVLSLFSVQRLFLCLEKAIWASARHTFYVRQAWHLQRDKRVRFLLCMTPF